MNFVFYWIWPHTVSESRIQPEESPPAGHLKERKCKAPTCWLCCLRPGSDAHLFLHLWFGPLIRSGTASEIKALITFQLRFVHVVWERTRLLHLLRAFRLQTICPWHETLSGGMKRSSDETGLAEGFHLGERDWSGLYGFLHVAPFTTVCLPEHGVSLNQTQHSWHPQIQQRVEIRDTAQSIYGLQMIKLKQNCNKIVENCLNIRQLKAT